MTIPAWAIVALVLSLCGGCLKRPKPSTLETLAGERRAAAEAAARDAGSLAAAFAAEPDEARRVELIFQLGSNGSPAAQETLARIYHATSDAGRKIEIIEALGFIENEALDPALRLLADAVAEGRPEELREAAVGTLRDWNTRATLPVWEILLRDPSAEWREAAREAIEYYRTFEQ